MKTVGYEISKVLVGSKTGWAGDTTGKASREGTMRDEEGKQVGLPLQSLSWGPGYYWGIRGKGQSNWDPLPLAAPNPRPPPQLSKVWAADLCEKQLIQRAAVWGQCARRYLTQVRSVPTHIMVRGGQCIVLTWSTAVKSGCPSPPKKDSVLNSRSLRNLSQPEVDVSEAKERPKP